MPRGRSIFPVELVITEDSDRIGTANLQFVVEASPHPEDTIDGDAESAIPVLTALVERIEDAASEMQTLTATANTLPQGSNATASYDSDTNTLTLGIPTGRDGYLTDNTISFTDPDADGHIVISTAE